MNWSTYLILTKLFFTIFLKLVAAVSREHLLKVISVKNNSFIQKVNSHEEKNLWESYSETQP